ncbi:hypothetical protein [Streptomyces hygroscopicus]
MRADTATIRGGVRRRTRAEVPALQVAHQGRVQVLAEPATDPDPT